MIVPGERFPASGGPLIGYLRASRELDAEFPAFAIEIHVPRDVC